MMLSFQVRDMQKTIQKLLNRKRPPIEVMILKGHADYLGVAYTRGPKADRPESWMLDEGKPLGQVVRVKVADLFVALKDAKGVDEQEGIGDRGSGDPITS